MGAQCRAARDEVADQVGLTEARRDLDGAGKRDDLRLDAVLLEVVAENSWIGRRDTLSLKRLRPAERDSDRQSER
jgi:hypothetical protein